MAGYSLMGSNSLVQVLSPTVTEDMVLATIQTSPTGIVASAAVSQVSFDNNAAAESLTSLADNIEAIISQGKAVGGTGTSSLNASGLQSYFVTFTVAYNPPGAPPNSITADVDVPVNLLMIDDPEIGNTLVGEAEDKIDQAYASLVSLAGG